MGLHVGSLFFGQFGQVRKFWITLPVFAVNLDSLMAAMAHGSPMK
jgi:hypothetical protein